MKLKLSVIITAACLIAGCSSEKTIDKGTPDENGMPRLMFLLLASQESHTDFIMHIL